MSERIPNLVLSPRNVGRRVPDSCPLLACEGWGNRSDKHPVPKASRGLPLSERPIHLPTFIAFLLIACSAFLALSVLSCGSDGQGQEVSYEDYGDRWPLTVDEATLHCEEVEVWDSDAQLVWVESKGYAYPVNGTAKSFLKNEKPGLNVRDFHIIWSADMDRPGFMVNVMPLLNDGLEMCESG